MICLSNGHCFEYVIPSGIMGFDGKGGPLKRFFQQIHMLKPELFTIVIKTLTEEPRKGNKVWYNPLRTVRFIPGGMVNAVGLTNPGVDWWCSQCAPFIRWSKFSLVGSIYSENIDGLCCMAEKLNEFPLKALEINGNCPNVPAFSRLKTRFIVKACERVREASEHPIILKISAAQDYKEIVRRTFGIVEAISINSVPWNMAFPYRKSPLAKFGNGAVSGGAAQPVNWRLVREIATLNLTPVIAPSIWREGDIERARKLGEKVQAVSCGAGISRHPKRMFRMIQRDQQNKIKRAC